jgi:hypothetical protein
MLGAGFIMISLVLPYLAAPTTQAFLQAAAQLGQLAK